MKLILVLLQAVTLTACATYQSNVHMARIHLKEQRPAEAAQILKPLALREGKDQLVYLLDYGTALQQAGQFEESNKAFILADQLSEVKDYHSISKITTSLLFSEEMVQYKGEDYERIFINAMSAINFLMLKNYESAQVETRRLNEKLYHYKSEAKRNYDNPFAHYLSGMIWEQDRKYDDAYIDYERAVTLDPDNPILQEDIVRMAAKAQRWTAYKKWTKEFNVKVKKEWSNKAYGQIVLLYQQGWGPEKRPNPQSPRFPMLYAKDSHTGSARLVVEGGPTEEAQTITNVDQLSVKSFNAQMGQLIAKRLAGFAAKEVVADQVRQKDELLGAILKIGMHISDRADLRHWSTLPESYQVAKVWVKPGQYNVSVEGLSLGGELTGEKSEPQQVHVEAGKSLFSAGDLFYKKSPGEPRLLKNLKDKQSLVI